jgi:hypothetical protein
MKGVKCDLTTDYVDLIEHAAWCENNWGRDHGNGWLLNHPLKKLLIFQQFCLQNPDFLDKDCTHKEYMMDGDEVEGEWEGRGANDRSTTTTTTAVTTLVSAPSLLNKSSSPAKKSRSPARSPAGSPAKVTRKRDRASPLEAVIPQPKSPSPVKKAKTGKSKLQLLKEKRDAMKKAKEAEEGTEKTTKRTVTPKKATKTNAKDSTSKRVSPKRATTGTTGMHFKLGQNVLCQWDASTVYDGSVSKHYPKGTGRFNDMESYDITFNVDNSIAEVKHSQLSLS